jgi:adenylylsulfate kinase-like enzyme
MYEKAEAGEIEGFTGVDAPYEEPVNPDIHLDTANETVEESASKVIVYLEKEGFLQQTSDISSDVDDEDEIEDRLKNLGYI